MSTQKREMLRKKGGTRRSRRGGEKGGRGQERYRLNGPPPSLYLPTPRTPHSLTAGVLHGSGSGRHRREGKGNHIMVLPSLPPPFTCRFLSSHLSSSSSPSSPDGPPPHSSRKKTPVPDAHATKGREGGGRESIKGKKGGEHCPASTHTHPHTPRPTSDVALCFTLILRPPLGGFLSVCGEREGDKRKHSLHFARKVHNGCMTDSSSSHSPALSKTNCLRRKRGAQKEKSASQERESFLYFLLFHFPLSFHCFPLSMKWAGEENRNFLFFLPAAPPANVNERRSIRPFFQLLLRSTTYYTADSLESGGVENTSRPIIASSVIPLRYPFFFW